MTSPLKKTPKVTPVYISPRFHQVVALHVLKNMLVNIEAQVPLLLGIHGPTGEGKTFQIENALKAMGVKRFLISGGQLDNSIAGESAHIVRATYIRASESLRGGECSLAAVLINDIDTGLGSWGESVQYTVNQLTVFGELMHLVDYPNAVEGHETLRVPIIITGNDFTKLYEPLVRAGRMTAFEWMPTLEERVELVNAIFPELTPEEVLKLIHELNQRVTVRSYGHATVLPVAFYAHLRSNLLDEDLWGLVSRSGLNKTIDTLLRGYEPDLALGIHYERVLAKGLELAASGQLINHFKNGEK
jgi:hypothetical protein